MRFDVITIFPEALKSYLNASILKRAQERGLISVRLHGLRKWGKGRHRQLDDKPYGGGAGMVLMAEPILKAAAAAVRRIRNHESGIKEAVVVLLSAKGRQFNQKMAYGWARRCKRLILISGRYEGIDERVKTAIHHSGFKIQEISIGPYVLTDGDVAAMAIVSAVSRLIPGVIRLESLQEESHWNLLLKRERKAGERGVEYPHYTRPGVLRWKGKRYSVPKVLLSGDHRRIAAWRARQRYKAYL